MDLSQLIALVAVAAAWDTARRLAEAFHSRAKLTVTEDLAHEAMTKAEELGTELHARLDIQSKALSAQGEVLTEHGRKLSAMALSKSR